MKQLLYYKFCSFVYKGSPGMDTDTDTHHLKCKKKHLRIQKLKAFESNINLCKRVKLSSTTFRPWQQKIKAKQWFAILKYYHYDITTGLHWMER